MLDLKFFLRVGPNTRDRYRKHIFEDAKDVFGKSFKGYTKKYGERKKANKFKRQATQYASSNAPVLTSDLLRDFSLIKTMTNGFQLGFAAFGARVQHLKKMGRVLSAPNQALPDGVIQYLSKEASIYINKKLPKGKKRYRIGK
tara:strand:+ start:1393 stop:1821 length:429 start_codon:yes stop_codon:yes gene_type:complete